MTPDGHAIDPITLTAIVDASYQADRGVTGIGIVLHATSRPGRAGPVVARIAEAHVNVLASAIELFAVFRALELARERGARRVKVRSDYNHIRRQLKRDHAAAHIADPDSLHGRTLSLARTFDQVAFAYQPRRKNGEAHRLARAATRLPLGTRHRHDVALERSDLVVEPAREDTSATRVTFLAIGLG